MQDRAVPIDETLRALDDLVQDGAVDPDPVASAEAAVDLAKLAGLTPAGVLVEVVDDDGTMKRAAELREFADEHDLAMISIEDLVRYRRRVERHVERPR